MFIIMTSALLMLEFLFNKNACQERWYHYLINHFQAKINEVYWKKKKTEANVTKT